MSQAQAQAQPQGPPGKGPSGAGAGGGTMRKGGGGGQQPATSSSSKKKDHHHHHSSTKSSRSRRKKKEEENKTKLKVVVRRLPPNLPEDVFWKSVEPWTGPQRLESEGGGAKSRGVGGETVAADNNKAVEIDRPASQDNDAVATGSSDDAAPATSDITPTKPGPLISLGGTAQDKLIWRRWVQGKFKIPQYGFASTSSRPDPTLAHIHSRAYLRFRTLPDLLNFHKNFDGHIFRDSKGNESIALVEWSSFQKIPPPPLKKQQVVATSIQEASIESDADYISFLESLKESSGTTTGGKEKEKTDAELMAYLTTSQSTIDQAKAKNTPLLEYLRKAKQGNNNKKGSKGGATAAASSKSSIAKGKAKKPSNRFVGLSQWDGNSSDAATASSSTTLTSKSAKAIRTSKATTSSSSSSSVVAPSASSSPIPTGPKSRKDRLREKQAAVPDKKAAATAAAVADKKTGASATGNSQHHKKNKSKQSGPASAPASTPASTPAPSTPPVILKRDAVGDWDSPAPASTSSSTQPRTPIPTGPRNQRGGHRGGGGGRGGRGSARGGKPAAPRGG